MIDDDCLQERSVFRRLLDNAAKVMEKKQLQEQLSHRPFDPRTGRELFKPHIGRKPYNRNSVQLPIGEYLHKMNCAFHSKIKSLASRDNKMKKEQARGRYVGPNSQRLLERLKDRGFKQVFDFLDADKVFPYLFCSSILKSFIIKKERNDGTHLGHRTYSALFHATP